MLDKDIEVFVMTCGQKPSITMEQLDIAGIPYNEHCNPDWEFYESHPENLMDRTADRPFIHGYALRQYRAFRGHQAMCAAASSPYTLIFEDDANPTVPTAEWTRIVNRCKAFLANGRYEAVSFHVRKPSTFKIVTTLFGKRFGELQSDEMPSGSGCYLYPVTHFTHWRELPRTGMKWHEGCLAYLIGETGRQKWITAQDGGGMPCDLYLANGLNTLVLEETQTLFQHDESYGSAIANSGACAQQADGNGIIHKPGGQEDGRHHMRNGDGQDGQSVPDGEMCRGGFPSATALGGHSQAADCQRQPHPPAGAERVCRPKC